MRPLITGLSFLALTLSVAAAPVPKERAEAEKVIGTWKLVKSSKASPPGITVALEMDLTQNGKVILRQSMNGGPIVIYEGEYTVNKSELPYSIKYPGGGIKKETLTIKKLTDNEMFLVDPDGIQEDFERVKPKKIEEPKVEKP
jgi:uncharacterized protein (TIGR03066 family)